MKVQTIKYDVDKPTPQQITVPLNSDYSLGVKVYKDGEQIELKSNQLSVDGEVATGQENSYNIFELSSGSDVGMKQLDVEMQGGLQGEISLHEEGVGGPRAVKQWPLSIMLSSVLTETTKLRPYDIQWTELLGRVAASSEEYPEEWTNANS